MNTCFVINKQIYTVLEIFAKKNYYEILTRYTCNKSTLYIGLVSRWWMMRKYELNRACFAFCQVWCSQLNIGYNSGNSLPECRSRWLGSPCTNHLWRWVSPDRTHLYSRSNNTWGSLSSQIYLVKSLCTVIHFGNPFHVAFLSIQFKSWQTLESLMVVELATWGEKLRKQLDWPDQLLLSQRQF